MKKKKQSASGIFFSMFLRAIVVILAIVIVCLIVALVRSLLHGKETKKTENNTGSGQVTVEKQEDELLTAQKTEAGTESKDATKDLNLKIAVLNGTQTAGLAGAWKEKLEGDGFTSVEAGNYIGETKKSVIYVTKEGADQSLKSYFPGAGIETTALNKEETDVDISGMDVVIVIGTEDDILSKQ